MLTRAKNNYYNDYLQYQKLALREFIVRIDVKFIIVMEKNIKLLLERSKLNRKDINTVEAKTLAIVICLSFEQETQTFLQVILKVILNIKLTSL